MFAYCLNAPVNMDDQSGKLPAGVKPMQVAINDAYDAITTWWDEYGEIIDTGFVWIPSTVSVVFTVVAYTIPTFAVPKTVIVVMDVVAGAFCVRDTYELINMIIEKVVS